MNKFIVAAFLLPSMLGLSAQSMASPKVPTTAITTLDIQNHTSGILSVNTANETFNNVENSALSPNPTTISSFYEGQATQYREGQDYSFVIPFVEANHGYTSTLNVQYFADTGKVKATIVDSNHRKTGFHGTAKVTTQGSNNVVVVTFSTNGQ